MNASRDDLIRELNGLIRRDGNRVPGFKRFREITGLTESDLHRAGFARFSELVKAAGQTPASFNQVAYSHDELMCALANLTRELGRFATHRDREVARKKDSTFPGDGAFRRISKTASLKDQLRDWCQVSTEYADIITFLGPVGSSATTVSGKPAEIGYVYLLRDGRRYKIGHTNSLGRRHAEASTWLNDARIVHHIPTDDPEGIERYWHHRFGSRHIDREWFALEASDIAAFKRWRKIV